MTDYRPVSCEVHSLYEEAILFRRALRLSWKTPEGAMRTDLVRPMDVVTQDGEEFLIARTESGEELRLRLDCIRQVEQMESRQ